MLRYQAIQDGNIEEDARGGKLACIQSPDGHMFAVCSKVETPVEETQPDDHPAAPEIKRLLERIKI